MNDYTLSTCPFFARVALDALSLIRVAAAVLSLFLRLFCGMEVPHEVFSVKPPRLEDPGLEDTALSADGIQEAFRIAAQKVRCAATEVLGNLGLKDDGCTGAPVPGYTEWEDTLVDHGENAKKGSCVDTQTGGLIEEGHDAVVDGGGIAEDKVIAGEEAGPRLGDSGCVKGDNKAGLFEPPAEAAKEMTEEEDAPGLTEAAI